MSEIGAEELRALRAGDVRALEACFRLYGARVWRVAYGLLGRAEDADDATQDVFLRILEKARLFDGRSRFSTWLHRLTVNHCKNRRADTWSARTTCCSPRISSRPSTGLSWTSRAVVVRRMISSSSSSSG